MKDYNAALTSLKICLEALWYLLMDLERLEQENVKKSDKIYISMLATFVADKHSLDEKKTLAGRLFFELWKMFTPKDIVKMERQTLWNMFLLLCESG